MEKEVNGFDRFDRIHVFLDNGQSIVMDKVDWDFTDWGIIYGDNRKTVLYPWTRIKEVHQFHE